MNRQSRYASLKMLKNEAPIDRQIFNFPVPFKRDATPYQTYDFNKIVKESCSSHSTISGLKISKVIFMGDVSVGKTSLINRFCHNVFDRNYKATIGVDFEVERFDILHIPFNMQIWDTAGQEKFRSIASSYYRGAHIIAVVFDISSLITLSHCKQWIQDALLMSDSNPHLFLIGTKLDLVSVAAYNKIIEIASKEARRLGAELWVVSSNTGENVKEMFHRMAALAFDAGITREKEIVQQQTISIGNIVIAVVFDISSLITLSHCKQWIQDALLMCDSNPHLFLIRTKLDLVSVAAYNKIIEIASKEARRLGAELWVVSSNTGENVKEMFHRMAALAFDAGITREKEIVQQQTISIGNIENTNKSHLKITNENNKLKCNGCI